MSPKEKNTKIVNDIIGASAFTTFEEVKNETTAEYFRGNRFSVDAFESKYALVDRPEETYVEALKRVCDYVASVEKTEELRTYWSNRWFHEIYNDWWHPAGSIMQGAGSGRKVSLCNCTTISLGLLDDKKEWDSLESIIKNAGYTVAKAAAYRQGLGVDFCLAPETFVLTSDLRQVPIKDVNIGDEIIGFDENHNIDINRLKPSIVESKNTIKRPSYRITTDKGHVVASAEHLWVARNGKQKPDGRMACKYQWITTDNLKVGYDIAFTISPWQEANSKQDGYFSGLLDAEGWASGGRVGIGQNDGIVYREIIKILDTYKIKYSANKNKKCININIKGKWESIKLLGMFRPPRLLSKSGSLWKNKKLTGQNEPSAKIISIEYLGETDVVALGTTTKTLIANGFLSHNSRLRPRGAVVSNSAKESTGSVHWMSFIDGIGNYVGQKGRIPAMLFSLSCEHPDVEEFITVKANSGKIQNANISVQCTDEFYDAVKRDKNWDLTFEIPEVKKGHKIYVDEHSITKDCKKDEHGYYVLAQKDKKKETIKKTVKAKDLMQLIAKNMHGFAEPGIQNIDIAHRYSNSDYVYDPNDEYDSRIISTNACSEQYLSRESLCVLASLNLGRFSILLEEYEKQLEIISPSINRFLDNVNECELVYHTYATPHQRMAIQKLRRIGAGFTNVAAWLFHQNIIYGAEESAVVLEKFTELYSYNLYKSSIEIGHEKGSFGLFKREKIENSPFVKKMMKKGLVFDALRNVTLISIAPTGTLSLMFRDLVMSYGIEPAFGVYWWKRTRMKGSYTYYFNVPSIVRETFKNAGFEIPMESDTIEDDWAGTKGKKIVAFIDENIKKIGVSFKSATEIKCVDKLELMSRVMKWVDSSISVTYMLPEDSNWKTVYEFIMLAHEKEVKSIAAFPDRKMYGIVAFMPFKDLAFKMKEEGVVMPHQNFSDEELKELSMSRESIKVCSQTTPERLEVLDADIHSITVNKEKFIIVIGLQNGEPFEVFGGKMNGLKIELDAKHISGKITRVKSGQYALEFEETVIKDFSKQFTPVEKFMFRSLSLMLQHGIPIELIADKLNKSSDDMFSISAATCRVLKKYIKDGKKVTGKTCPSCSSMDLVYNSGCTTCSNCGYSLCN